MWLWKGLEDSSPSRGFCAQPIMEKEVVLKTHSIFLYLCTMVAIPSVTSYFICIGFSMSMR